MSDPIHIVKQLLDDQGHLNPQGVLVCSRALSLGKRSVLPNTLDRHLEACASCWEMVADLTELQQHANQDLLSRAKEKILDTNQDIDLWLQVLVIGALSSAQAGPARLENRLVEVVRSNVEPVMLSPIQDELIVDDLAFTLKGGQHKQLMLSIFNSSDEEVFFQLYEQQTESLKIPLSTLSLNPGRYYWMIEMEDNVYLNRFYWANRAMIQQILDTSSK